MKILHVVYYHDTCGKQGALAWSNTLDTTPIENGITPYIFLTTIFCALMDKTY